MQVNICLIREDMYRSVLVCRSLKAGSQSDTRPCVALICETHKFITKKLGISVDDQTQERNAG